MDKNSDIAYKNNCVVQKGLDKSTLDSIDSFFKENNGEIIKLKKSIYENPHIQFPQGI